MNRRKGLAFFTLALLLVAIRLVSAVGAPMKKPNVYVLTGTKSFEGKQIGPIDYTINIVGKQFKPPSSIDLSQFSTSGKYVRAIVQFKGPIKGEWLSDINSLGAKVESYIPNFALLLSVPSDKLEDLANRPFVRWMGPFTSEYKEGPLKRSPLLSRVKS